MRVHTPPPIKSTAYIMQREMRGDNVLRCVNGCESPRLPPFTTCRVCRGKIWRQGAQKAARVRKRMLRARESAL